MHGTSYAYWEYWYTSCITLFQFVLTQTLTLNILSRTHTMKFSLSLAARVALSIATIWRWNVNGSCCAIHTYTTHTHTILLSVVVGSPNVDQWQRNINSQREPIAADHGSVLCGKISSEHTIIKYALVQPVEHYYISHRTVQKTRHTARARENFFSFFFLQRKRNEYFVICTIL